MLVLRLEPGREGFVLPCGHEVIVPLEWIGPDGYFLGRLGCAWCPRDYDEVLIELEAR